MALPTCVSDLSTQCSLLYSGSGTSFPLQVLFRLSSYANYDRLGVAGVAAFSVMGNTLIMHHDWQARPPA